MFFLCKIKNHPKLKAKTILFSNTNFPEANSFLGTIFSDEKSVLLKTKV